VRTAREQFFPSELYWLDRVGPVSRLTQAHGGVASDVEDLVTIDPNGSPLLVMFDRLIEPDWADRVGDLYFRVSNEQIILDARVTLHWPTVAGVATWKGYDAPYMILNLYELLMRLALVGAGLIRLYGYRHPHPVNRKFIPMPWADVYVVALLIARDGGALRVECEPAAPTPLYLAGWP
jgi:hypothetical protein